MTHTHQALDSRSQARGNPFLAWPRFLLIVGCSLVFAMFFPALKLFVRKTDKRMALAAAFTRAWGRFCCRVAGYRMRVSGPLPPSGSLLAPNHQGYVDIIAVAACVPCLFVAKAETRGWPLFGTCIRVFEHVFVTRRKARAMRETVDAVEARLRQSVSVCLFPEGTSSGGGKVLPFTSSFFEPALRSGAPIVPVTIIWGSLNPRVDRERDIAYWGSHRFLFHILRHLGLRKTTVHLIFSPPLTADSRSDRKTAAQSARAAVMANYTF